MKRSRRISLNRQFWIAPVLAIGLAATPALAQDAPQQARDEEAKQEQASIAFVSHGGIRDWQADDRETLYIQDRSRQWYKAKLMSPSHELPFAWKIGFDTGPVDRLDRFSSVVVDGFRHPIESLVKVHGPPPQDS